MTNEKAITLVNDAFGGYYSEWAGTFTEAEKDELAEANRIAIEALDKDINVPSKSALDHIHNVVRDDAYKRGYEQGKADAVPMEWIKKKRDEVVSDYKYIIDWLILEWRKEQKGSVT